MTSPSLKFQHPCSIVLSGPSGSGKTVLTKKILVDEWIEQLPQRINWCYGQYQPLYDEMKKQLPGIEFVKGIPNFLEQEWYLDPSVRNCIVLDDLMGDAKKDERISNLFTRGSHHRNLTVLYLTQNLFPQGKACRDISLNTKYLILFNNPTDKVQVMTLARRIYPTNTHVFMNTYEQAVERPYGHLVVDLRPITLEKDRLHPNMLCIRGTTTSDSRQDMSDTISDLDSIVSEESDCIPDMPSCSFCGIMFGDVDSLQQHVKQWCMAKKRDETTEPEAKRQKASIEDLNIDLYFPWTKPHVKSEWLDKVKQKEEEMGSINRAINSLLPGIQKTIRQVLGNFLLDISNIQQDALYQTLMKTAQSLMQNNGVDMEAAIRQAIKMQKLKINKLFMPPREESDSDQSDDEVDNDDESEIED